MADQQRGVAYGLFERVNNERAEQGWTWMRLQERSGVARSTIYSWAKIQTPPQPATVNPVADALGIPRIEALRLAGILQDGNVGLTAECEVERQILATSIDPGFKREIVLQHREKGHTARCGPYEVAQDDLTALGATAVG